MNEYSTDPFHRVKGTENSPQTVPVTSTSMVDAPVNTPYQQKTVTIINNSAVAIATYDNLGLRIVHRKKNIPFGGFVRVQVAYKLFNCRLDEETMLMLMQYVSKEHISTIHAALQQKDSPHRTVYLHWDIPVELIQANLNGVLIEPLNQVIQLADNTNRTHLFYAWERCDNVMEPVVDEMTGIMAQFNKHDIAVDGVWINFNGAQPIQLARNQCDRSKPEGLTVVMNGTPQFFPIEEMRANGYYMSQLTAAAAHASSTAEITTIHKTVIQEKKEAAERQSKEDDKRYERASKEDTQEWERQFKIDERQTKLDDKKYDRSQMLVDKRSIRKFSFPLQAIQCATALLGMVSLSSRVYTDIIKVVQQVKGV